MTRAAKSKRSRFFWLAPLGRVLLCLIVLAYAAMPAFAAEEAAPDPANSPAGTIFRWLNFALVFGSLAYLLGKFGGPYFRNRAKSVSASIREAMEARSAAERELQQATQRLSSVNLEIQELRRAAASESAAESGRIRALASAETDKIGQVANAEILAAERAARQELRALAARMASERAVALVRARMNAAMESALFRSFVDDMARGVQ